eukprot:3348561-Pleurochrysis_carterae.AAC.2
MTWMCEVARDECMARARCGPGSTASRRVTCHSSNPPRRMNGSRVRCPRWSGAISSRARTFAKRQSVPVVAQSCPTESSESRIEGTQRTPVSVRLTKRHRESRAVMGMSPIQRHTDAVFHLCLTPSQSMV